MLFLYRHSWVNRLRSQAARVRSPRYIAAVVLGMTYLYWALFRNTRAGGAPLTQLLLADATVVFASTLLLLSSARWWVFGADRSALAFTPAEVQFLFPAPITRRGLVHTKLLRMQFAIFVNTIIFSVIFRGDATPAHAHSHGRHARLALVGAVGRARGPRPLPLARGAGRVLRGSRHRGHAASRPGVAALSRVADGTGTVQEGQAHRGADPRARRPARGGDRVEERGGGGARR
ncbi:MAG: hypothetical protein EBV77_11515, partial [Gemmatimonadaceae bacterium]|nr:hypothetical protein [Gemmatimonadaceae bacterium]